MTKSLIRATSRRGTRADKSPPIARKAHYRDPSICDRCGAVYTARTWRLGRRLTSEAMAAAAWVVCPACAQTAAGRYFGRVLIGVPAGFELDQLAARIRNVERRQRERQPERRIVSMEMRGGKFEVQTTSQKLAHRIAREVEKAFGGRARFVWSDGDGALLAQVEIARRAKPATRARSLKSRS